MNKGQCGLCGDSFSDPTPRPHELGGLYGQGALTADYVSGSKIRVGVRITANHKGYFLFDLCNLDKYGKESDECFEGNLLNLVNGNDKYILPSDNNGWFNTTLQLPAGLDCKHCVLRWTYNTGKI